MKPILFCKVGGFDYRATKTFTRFISSIETIIIKFIDFFVVLKINYNDEAEIVTLIDE